MKRTTTSVFDKLKKEKDLDDRPYTYVRAQEEMKNCIIRYYVTTIGEPILCDIPDLALVKSPAKYFKNLNMAMIYQDQLIIEAYQSGEKNDWLSNFTIDEINDIQDELDILCNQYPELVLILKGME